jgi:hypothetical protein
LEIVLFLFFRSFKNEQVGPARIKHPHCPKIKVMTLDIEARANSLAPSSKARPDMASFE